MTHNITLVSQPSYRSSSTRSLLLQTNSTRLISNRPLRPATGNINRRQGRMHRNNNPYKTITSSHRGTITRISKMKITHIFSTSRLVPVVLRLHSFRVQHPEALHYSRIRGVTSHLQITSKFTRVLPHLPHAFLAFLVSTNASTSAFRCFNKRLTLIRVRYFTS